MTDYESQRYIEELENQLNEENERRAKADVDLVVEKKLSARLSEVDQTAATVAQERAALEEERTALQLRVDELELDNSVLENDVAEAKAEVEAAQVELAQVSQADSRNDKRAGHDEAQAVLLADEQKRRQAAGVPMTPYSCSSAKDGPWILQERQTAEERVAELETTPRPVVPALDMKIEHRSVLPEPVTLFGALCDRTSSDVYWSTC